jgi:hypothetical protein
LEYNINTGITLYCFNETIKEITVNNDTMIIHFMVSIYIIVSMSATITEKIITDIPIITTGDCLRKQIILLTAILSQKNNKLMILY